jgi:hypothetical protein
MHTCNRRRFCPLPGICPSVLHVTECLALLTQLSAPPHSVHRLAPVGSPEAQAGRGRRDDKFQVEDEIPIVDEDDYVQDSDDDIVDEDEDDGDDEDAQKDDLTLHEARSYGRKTPKQREERRADIQVLNASIFRPKIMQFLMIGCVQGKHQYLLSLGGTAPQQRRRLGAGGPPKHS